MIPHRANIPRDSGEACRGMPFAFLGSGALRMNPKAAAGLSVVRSTVCGVGAIAGGFLAAFWFWMLDFGFCFFGASTWQFRRDCAMVLLALAGASTLLVLVQPPAQRFTQFVLATPTVLLIGAGVASSSLEGGGERWDRIAVAVLAVGAVLGGGVVARGLLRRFGADPGSRPIRERPDTTRHRTAPPRG
jgi:hypothetical protein